MSISWLQARSQMMLEPLVANLNTGSFGPLPRVVFDRVTELRRHLAAEPTDFFLRQAPLLLWQARENLAKFLGAIPHRLIFTVNVSAAINMIAAGLRLASPGEILLTDQEYGAMHWCWERAARRQSLTLRTFPLLLMPKTSDEIVEAFCSAFSDRTRLVFFSHILSPTGLVLPARAICAEARRRGILTVIDGAHAVGMIPLNLDQLGCDFYAGNCHKWLLAPTGAGFLYLGEGSEDRIQPLQVSWGWHHDRSRPDVRDEFGSTPRIRAFEFEGTRDLCPWLSVPKAIEFQSGLGWERIRERIAELAAHVRAMLSGITDLSLVTPPSPGLHGAMTAFRLPASTDPMMLRSQLWEQYRIEVNYHFPESPTGALLRVSTHFYNTEEEVDRLAFALKTLLAS